MFHSTFGTRPFVSQIILLYIFKVLLLTVTLGSFASASCQNDTDCGPEGVARCNSTTGMCECLNDCYNLQNNSCTRKPCTSLEDDGECLDGLKSRTTALLLSIFLINFGAANFYIERYELAATQLFLGLVLCCVQVRTVTIVITLPYMVKSMLHNIYDTCIKSLCTISYVVYFIGIGIVG